MENKVNLAFQLPAKTNLRGKIDRSSAKMDLAYEPRRIHSTKLPVRGGGFDDRHPMRCINTRVP